MNEVKYISKTLDELRQQLDEMPKRFVTQDEWTPVRNVVYGVVGLLLTSIIVAITSLVVKK